MHRLSASASVLAVLTAMVACHGASPEHAAVVAPAPDGSDGVGAPPREGSSAPALDHGSPSSVYPAFPPDPPQLVNRHGGGVLASPVLVTVTWPGGPPPDAIAAFAQAIGDSTYWKSVAAEYGVGPARSSASDHVRMPSMLPPSITADAIAALIAQHVFAETADGGAPTAPAWPSFTDQTIYTLFIPSSTKVFDSGATEDICAQNGGGYHDTTTAQGQEIVFAVVLDCAGSAIDATTLVASHEWAEAATDPRARTAPAFQGLDSRHLAFDALLGFEDEVGDLCAGEADAQLDAAPSFPFATQRQWSNASARLGHDPCVPAPSGPYATVVVLDPLSDRVAVAFAPDDPSPQLGAGIVLRPGETRVLALGFESDALSEPFSVSFEEWLFTAEGRTQPAMGEARGLDLVLDKTSGQNGEKAYLGVTRKSGSSNVPRIVALKSTLNGVVRTAALLVGAARP